MVNYSTTMKVFFFLGLILLGIGIYTPYHRFYLASIISLIIAIVFYFLYKRR